MARRYAMRSLAHAWARQSGEEGIVSVAMAAKRWTLEELHSLPDDGNKYELVNGELFVTPPPSFAHETVGAKLGRELHRYVNEQRLGLLYTARSVLRFRGSEVEPDLMVLPTPVRTDIEWDDVPVPLLVVEILSPSTRRRDHEA